jgi:hypothetical protein
MTTKEFTEALYQHDLSIRGVVPAFAVPKQTFKFNTANGLTRATLIYIRVFLKGQAERISSMGRVIKNGGKNIYIKGTSLNGTADISALIKGKTIKIEVKIGKDRQSDKQKEYEKMITENGGYYLIAKDFEQITNDLNKILNENK